MSEGLSNSPSLVQSSRSSNVASCAVSSKQSEPSVAYIVSQELVEIASFLPSNKNRSLLVHSLINSLGLLTASMDSGIAAFRLVRPRLASVQELCVYHDTDYVDFVLNSKHSVESLPGFETSLSHQGHGASDFGIEDDCPPFRGMDKYVQLVAGATLTAAELLRTGSADIAIFWDGGRHHAQKSRAAGFCYVADCILAILALKKSAPIQTFYQTIASKSGPSRKKARVMYLDLDLHFSDAVSECFYNVPAPQIHNRNVVAQVLTLSMHHAAPGFYPATPRAALPDPSSSGFDPFTLAVPLKQGASAKTFARVWNIVESVKEVFTPDYVVLQCGADGLAGDPHGVWNWSTGRERGTIDWCVGEVIKRWGVKVLLLGGGGYNSPNAARTWACLTSLARGKSLSSDMAIPEHSAFPLYAPSFTLDVPAGNMRDENSDGYLRSVEEVYEVVIRKLRERCT
ncbi:histone deacetylase 8 [Phellopilus nigrolimitatus]|nr:histone deacetylase 8 [Phellopilus nigrolimitatus]